MTVTHLHTPTEAPATRTIRNTIKSTIHPGDQIVIPFGSWVWDSDTEGHVSKKSVRVTAVSTEDGYVDVFNTHGNGKGFVILPQVSWIGDGGRTKTTKVTPEFCAISEVLTPRLPRFELRRRNLDYVPVYGPGYDNRDVE